MTEKLIVRHSQNHKIKYACRLEIINFVLSGINQNYFVQLHCERPYIKCVKNTFIDIGKCSTNFILGMAKACKNKIYCFLLGCGTKEGTANSYFITNCTLKATDKGIFKEGFKYFDYMKLFLDSHQDESVNCTSTGKYT